MDHQVVFGRRGTGKTHIFNYLSDTRAKDGDVVVYIDLSNIGSSGGIYSDQSILLTERATRLLVDVLLAVHATLFEYFVENSEEFDLSQTGPLLDQFGDLITQVRVVGEVETKEGSTHSLDTRQSSGLRAAFSPDSVEVGADENSSTAESNSVSAEVGRRGREQHAVHFGSARKVWEKMIEIISPKSIWLLLDEWSSVPIELQPYLADLVRRSVFPVRGVVVKIAAIEQRSMFSLSQAHGNYLGIELGADAAADVNLDDFMVFDNDEVRARAFYRSLLYKHIQATDVLESSDLNIKTEIAFLGKAFTQVNTFDELVRASEGVPRDAINVVIQAAQYAGESAIAVEDIRRAAHAWYQRDKETAVKSKEKASRLLHWVITEVIGARRARAFLLQTDARDELIESLYDARVIHILKRNISTPDAPGVRFNVYKLDYGCYVDLMATTKSPLGLLPLDDLDGDGNVRFIEVPPDDYRAIRRAILDINEFYRYVANIE
ncbi:MAG: ATP-binding protein [Candidatus Thiodiazotropha lotti]|uniref:ATP-binding protein n=1 Tax=Candidatus Thiodiazotropha lotti TaxID=2792787 RepID=A0A9E4K706_9GAMM|nr:ATP-binding protein [Candidatus Thiodiazotropha lotti]MCW4204502.1 ATP-binding protein [Candidatus Thiodiazotropha lotti]